MVLFKSLHKSCPDCGSNNWKNPILKDAIICKDCNHATNPDLIVKGREFTGSKRELENEPIFKEFSANLKDQVDDKIIEGWKVLELESDCIVMGKNKKGGVVQHGVIGFFTLFTMGAGNVAYHEYKKRDFEVLVLRDNKEPTVKPTAQIEGSLNSLEQLFNDDLITEQEYEQKRSELIDSI